MWWKKCTKNYDNQKREVKDERTLWQKFWREGEDIYSNRLKADYKGRHREEPKEEQKEEEKEEEKVKRRFNRDMC